MIAGFRMGKPRKLDQKQSGEPIVSLEAKSPLPKLLFITLFSVIWNGIVVLIFNSRAPILFGGLLGFFGLLSIAGVIHAALACLNPRPTAELTPGNLHPGMGAALRWSMSGNTQRIRSLSITLQCLHVTTVTRRNGGSTETREEKKPIFTEELFASEQNMEITQGATSFHIQEEQPASRTGSTDGIEWHILFHGDIPRWPDIKETMNFIVYPE